VRQRCWDETVKSENHNANLKIIASGQYADKASNDDTPLPAGAALPTRHRAPLAIELKDCVLRYPLGGFDRGSFKSLMLSAFSKRRSMPTARYVDALRGINLSIRQGERVALLGHNGSGKSTLLQTMAGVYPLSSGSRHVSGRIGTLFGLGQGFDDDATGRENIYYRGMAMGYPQRLLAQHEQEIIDFCSLGDFIDLPVRTYSNGMFVRLAFAISTQFSPDVLLIDEIFGAGDATFRQRAHDRMLSIVKNAGILVMATHDLGIIKSVCDRVVWLDGGRIIADGPTEPVLHDYYAHLLTLVS